MLFYHIDHGDHLSAGMIIAPSFIHLAGVDWSLPVCASVRETFNDGLSRYGTRTLLETNSSDCLVTTAFDFILETVRLRVFPALPSRLSSFFGMRDLSSSFDKWKGRFEKDVATFRAFECESDIVYSADASFLDYQGTGEPYRENPLRAEQPSDKAPFPLSFPAFQVHAARLYWKSCVPLTAAGYRQASSDTAPAQCNPCALEELLVPGHVRVLREVPLP